MLWGGEKIIYKDKELLYSDLKLTIIKDNTGRFLLQEKISNQHEQINKIFSKSINTIRLCTIYNKETCQIEVLSAVLRIGTGKHEVDNWAIGGLSVGIDIECGVLEKYGYYKPSYGTKTDKHPDTNIAFEGYKIPYFSQAVDMAKEFHRRLYGIHSVGWDIAITQEGPMFVEGNDIWEISLMQASNHGYQKEFNKLFK